MPENRAVMETARFVMVVAVPSSASMSGLTLTRVWANSQKVRTARTAPNSHESVARNPSARGMPSVALASAARRARGGDRQRGRRPGRGRRRMPVDGMGLSS